MKQYERVSTHLSFYGFSPRSNFEYCVELFDVREDDVRDRARGLYS